MGLCHFSANQTLLREASLWKNPKGKVMSTSVLYHTFGIVGVQYRKSVFLAARQYSMAAFIRII